MAWIRLDDDYIYHPKFVALSAGAFRLWHEGMAYCRKLLTDGLIPRAALRTFRYAKRAHVDELSMPIGTEVAPLWEPIDDFGFKVHDYLIWNRSREQELEDRERAKQRAKKSRGGQADEADACGARAVHVLGAHATGCVQNQNKNGVRVLPEKGSGEKPTLAHLPGRPLPGYPRLRLFRWQVDDLLASLGAREFDLDGWLSTLEQNGHLVIPADRNERWTWLKQAFDYELRTRGLVAGAGASLDARTDRVRELLKQREAR